MTGYVGKLTHGVEASHVEICVSDGAGYLASSIYNGESVNVNSRKTFANPGQYGQSVIEYLICHPSTFFLRTEHLYHRVSRAHHDGK